MLRTRIIVLGAALAVVAIAVLALSKQRPQFQVVGDLTDKEVREIARQVRVSMRPPLLRDRSWKSVGELPAVLRERFGTRIVSIERRTQGFVAVRTASSATASAGRFWSVFREGDTWRVDGARSWGRSRAKRPVTRQINTPPRWRWTNSPQRSPETNHWAKSRAVWNYAKFGGSGVYTAR